VAAEFHSGLVSGRHGQMKLILSRKGFDSKYGGGPSPILNGTRLVSLPIEYGKREHRRQYNDLRFDGVNLGELIEQLYPKKRSRYDYCHLDPDLRRDMLPQRECPGEWRPLFGQADSNASHLVATHKVGEGDIFLFFGLFRNTNGWNGFVRGAPKIHVIHGWLQVDKVIHDPVEWVKTNRWASSHPHTYGDWWKSRNVLFVAKPALEIGSGRKRLKTQFPGAGVFHTFHERLCLSDPAFPRHPSRWRLPAKLRPDRENGRTISTLGNGTWVVSPDKRYVHFDPGYIRLWQESVISGNPDAIEWAHELIRAAN
jgi:hypothetical protein